MFQRGFPNRDNGDFLLLPLLLLLLFSVPRPHVKKIFMSFTYGTGSTASQLASQTASQITHGDVWRKTGANALN